MMHSDDGVIGMGPALPSGKEDDELADGALLHHADSFGMLRGGHLDAIGAKQTWVMVEHVTKADETKARRTRRHAPNRRLDSRS